MCFCIVEQHLKQSLVLALHFGLLGQLGECACQQKMPSHAKEQG